ncbi:bifunctional nuclease family protein [Dissulfurirhabdus thermomarina]|uniref:Bifunctional nuclease family protein n=2 Tax=Dissulfurirhabdus thermomarina TaxID=1765737 RepID=A0A6N9TM57_DISTH|nr:bifunctional nuclease family protein [Dissulfurirhabdus thermomarina]NMX23139.1 bifunctional nuclease family protein [Dissulfurirhabdus thermomarina]
MTAHAITIDAKSNSPILILKERGGERALPIWIGLLEATAIATEMEKIEFARPMTHDLALNLLAALGARITRIVVNDLRDNTYYALITLEKDGEVLEVDARPSDAVALALRAGAEIFVEEAVLAKSVPSREGTEASADSDKADKWLEILEGLDPEAFKYKM